MPQAPQNAITGIYRTSRDGGLTYTYEGKWSASEARLEWRVEVRRDGELKGSPSGHLSLLTDFDPLTIARNMIHDSIERLNGVSK